MPSHMNDPHSVEIGMGIIHMRTMPILGKSGLLMLRSGQEVLLARQNGVENHSHHERHRDAVGSEDGLEQRREVGENVADLGETDAGRAMRGNMERAALASAGAPPVALPRRGGGGAPGRSTV